MPDPKKALLQKLMETFRVEAEEHLQDIVSRIVQIEQVREGVPEELVAQILKRLHTLKGAARAVDLTDLEALCHAMEGVFSAIRSSHRLPDVGQFDILHQASNLARTLTSTPSGRTRNLAVALTHRLNNVSDALAGGGQSMQRETLQPVDPQDAESSAGAETGIDTASAANAPDVARNNVIRVEGRNIDAIRYQAEALLGVELTLQHQIADLLALADDMADEYARLHLVESTSHGASRKSLRGAHRGAGSNQADSMAEIGKAHAGFEGRCRRLAGSLSRVRRDFSLVRSRLLDATLETALVPCASALDQLPGLVRNLARSKGKEAILHMQGEGTRIDRRVLDALREVLIHLVTNAVDHGIEPVERRLAAGKPARGSVHIKVAQGNGNRVSVTVADDGAGIDVDAIVDAAARDGKLGAQQLAGLNVQQRLQLALRAGVSTSYEVTQVSGRGVGLAIVAEKVTSLGGELLIDNCPGQGCAFELRLPVRLATLRAVVLRSRGSSFVLPLSGVEAVRALKEGDIQTVENRETFLLAGQVVPAIRLGDLLGIERPRDAAVTDECIAVIARSGGHTFALLIDEILSEQEVLPKSLGKQLRRVRYIAGAAQLGDGSLVAILGLEDIARYGLVAGKGVAKRDDSRDARSAQRILVVEDSITSRLLLKHILEGAGYRVDTAVDGLDALSRLRQDVFDAVVSDVEMPQMNGFELTEQVRRNPKTEELPVILVTSLQSPEEKERGLRAGADAYVVKGTFDQDNLLTTIRRLI